MNKKTSIQSSTQDKSSSDKSESTMGKRCRKIMEMELCRYDDWITEVFPKLSSMIGDLHKVKPEFCKNWNNCRVILRQLIFNIGFIFAANEEINFLQTLERWATKGEVIAFRRAIYGQMRSIFHSTKERIAELGTQITSSLKKSIFSTIRYTFNS